MDILILRKSGGLGDIICCEPVIRGLRKKHPQSEIIFGMPREFVSLFDGRSEATFKGYQAAEFTVHWMRRYLEMHDIVIDLCGPESKDEKQGSPDCSRTESFCNFAGVPASCPEIHLTEDEGNEALKTLGQYPKPWSGIGPNGTNWTRNWPEDRWADLIKRTPGTKFYFDSKRESPFEGIVSFVGKPLRELASIIAQLDLMISVDTGLLHLAGALKTKTFSLWGPSDPRRTLKHYSDAYYINPDSYRAEAGCEKPCLYSPVNCTDVTGRFAKCMEKLETAEVIANVNAVLSDSPPDIQAVKAQDYETRVSLSRKGKKTRIVWVSENLLPARGGAERSAVELIRRLSGEGYEVMAFWSHHQREAFRHYGVEVIDGVVWAETPPGILLLKMLEAEPDIVITQLSAAAKIPKALPKRIPLFLMLRSVSDHFCPGAKAEMKCVNGETADLEHCGKECLESAELNKPFLAMKSVYKYADEVFANSQAMRLVFKHFTGRDCCVQYPVPERDGLEKSVSTKEFCVAIRPDMGRGLEFLRELAAEMPKEKFLWVDGPPSDLENVEIAERTEDLQGIFDKALVLLCPHVAYEAFGRVPAEAGYAGIPSIVTPNGGLPEAVGDGGYVEPLELGKWVKRIRSLRGSERTWSRRSNAASKHAATFDWSVLLDQIREYEAT